MSLVFLPHQPDGPIAEACDQMFYFSGYQPEHQVERLVPHGRMALVIELDGQLRHVHDNETLAPLQDCREAWISGMHTEFITISAKPNSELLAIELKPGRAFPFFAVPLNELSNRVLPAREVFGNAITDLRSQLLATESPSDKLKLATDWMNQRWDDTLSVDTAVSNAVAAIEANPTVNTIKALNENAPYSSKHFTQLFKKYVGITPKLLQRILRFQQVLPLIQEEKEVHWAQVGAECGYFDQAHFIRDFKNFSGYNPKDFLSEKHDRLNFFPLQDER